MKTKVFSDGFEGHKRRSLERAKRLVKGERLEAERVITFADPLDMVTCLSAERVRLVQTVRRKRLSISSLAEELGRNRGAVTRDVKKLAEFGLVRVRQQNNPGHGIVQIVEPIAHKLVMRADI
jgi:predicted transcriptional regulator